MCRALTCGELILRMSLESDKVQEIYVPNHCFRILLLARLGVIVLLDLVFGPLLVIVAVLDAFLGLGNVVLRLLARLLLLLLLAVPLLLRLLLLLLLALAELPQNYVYSSEDGRMKGTDRM